jgi:hypothetical protein
MARIGKIARLNRDVPNKHHSRLAGGQNLSNWRRGEYHDHPAQNPGFFVPGQGCSCLLVLFSPMHWMRVWTKFFISPGLPRE